MILSKSSTAAFVRGGINSQIKLERLFWEPVRVIALFLQKNKTGRALSFVLYKKCGS